MKENEMNRIILKKVLLALLIISALSSFVVDKRSGADYLWELVTVFLAFSCWDKINQIEDLKSRKND